MNKLLALKAVVEQQNVTKAAQILGYTQPGVTKMLQALENELGFALLIKKHNHIKLTPNGQKIYPFIMKIINDYQALNDQAKAIKQEASVIKIATIPSISQQWLPKLIAAFQIDHPKADFSIIQGDATSIPDWVANGNADLGFVNLRHPASHNGTVIQTQVLKAIVPAEWQTEFDQVIPLTALTTRPYVLLEEGLFSESLSAYQQLGLTPDLKMRLHDSFSTLLMVEQGIGYSIMPMEREVERQYQVKVFDTDPVIQRTISLIHKELPIMNAATKQFIQMVNQHFAKSSN